MWPEIIWELNNFVEGYIRIISTNILIPQYIVDLLQQQIKPNQFLISKLHVHSAEIISGKGNIFWFPKSDPYFCKNQTINSD